MLNRTPAGTLKSRLFETASTFAIGGALVLASPNRPANAIAFAQPFVSAQQVTPYPGVSVIPWQHRGPVQHASVHHDPQPLTPISAPIVSAPAVPAPAAPAAPSATPPVSRMEPLRINSADREQIIASHAEALRREHCLRKLEARQRELRQRSSQH